MSNVSRHGREQVACAAPSSAVAHCLSRSAEPARGRRAQRAGVAVRPTAARAPSCKCCGCSTTVALGCPSVGGQRTAVLRAARQRERVRGVPQRTNTCHCTHLAVCPGPASTQRLRSNRSLATAGIGHAAHAGGCLGRARRVRTAPERRGVANAALFAQAWRAMTANPSIERTSKRLRLFAAAHVER
jgi:hypothetical protein